MIDKRVILHSAIDWRGENGARPVEKKGLGVMGQPGSQGLMETRERDR